MSCNCCIAPGCKTHFLQGKCCKTVSAFTKFLETTSFNAKPKEYSKFVLVLPKKEGNSWIFLGFFTLNLVWCKLPFHEKGANVNNTHLQLFSSYLFIGRFTCFYWCNCFVNKNLFAATSHPAHNVWISMSWHCWKNYFAFTTMHLHPASEQLFTVTKRYTMLEENRWSPC